MTTLNFTINPFNINKYDFPSLLVEGLEQSNTKAGEEWLNFRKTKITGSNIPQIMDYVINGNYSYYGKSIFNFREEKIKAAQPVNSFQKEMFKNGHLAEEAIFAIISNALPKGATMHRSEILLSSCQRFMASLDMRVTTSCGKNIAYEVKSTSTKRIFDLYINRDHIAFYQLAYQMLIANCDYGYLVAHYIPESVQRYIKIDRHSKYFIDILNNINLLKRVYDDTFVLGVEPFFKPYKPIENSAMYNIEAHRTIAQYNSLNNVKKPKDTIQPEEKNNDGCIVQYDGLNSLLSNKDKVEIHESLISNVIKQREIVEKAKAELDRLQKDLMEEMRNSNLSLLNANIDNENFKVALITSQKTRKEINPLLVKVAEAHGFSKETFYIKQDLGISESLRIVKK